MADLVTRLTAQDNLSGTLKNVNNELKGLNQQSDKLDKFQAKFRKIEGSAAPLQRKLKDLKSLLAGMSLQGLDNTAAFSEAAQYAGQLRDAIGDANQSINNFASDTQTLDIAIKSFQGLNGVINLTGGVMTQLIGKNETMEKVTASAARSIQMLQQAQALANTFNKNGAIATGLNAAATKAMGRAATQAAAGSTVLAGANTALGVSIKGVGLAIKALPVIGWILAGISAVIDIVGVLTDYLGSASGKTEDFGDTLKDAEVDTFKYKQQIDATVKEIDAFCGSEEQEKALLEKVNNKYGESIGYCNSLKEAKEKLTSKGPAMVQVFMNEAKAQALAAKMAENYARVLDIQNSIKSGSFEHSWFKTDAQDIADLNREIGKLNDSNKALEQEMNRLYKANEKLKAQENIGGHKKPENTKNTGKGSKRGSKSGSSKKDEKTLEQGSLELLEKQLKDAEALYKSYGDKTSQDVKDKTKKTIDDLRKQVEDKKIEMGITMPKDLKEQFDDKMKELSALKARIGFGVSEDDFNREYQEIQDWCNANGIHVPITVELDPEKTVMEQYKDLQSEAAKYAEMYKCGLLTEVQYREALDDINDTIDSLNPKLHKLKPEIDAPEPTRAEQKKIDRTKEIQARKGDTPLGQAQSWMGDISSMTSGIDTIVSSVNSLNEALESGNGWEVFTAGIQMASDTLNGIATVIETVQMVMEALGVTTSVTSQISSAAHQKEQADATQAIGVKSAEAVVDATAEGAKMPFPYNIIAIATGVAAVVAALASVAGAFADGGIVGGSSYHGDRLMARVNSGEMILNGRQQKNLFNAINSGRMGSQQSGTVTWKIKGSDLYGALNNYTRRTNKIS